MSTKQIKTTAEAQPAVYLRACPICDGTEIGFLAPVWKNYHKEREFFTATGEWFADCSQCGTVLRFPLVDYGGDYRKYGEDYYDQGAVQGSVDAHAESHFRHFQQPNYDSVHAFLQATLPAQQYPRWLDVGSVGYATTFEDYDFTTIEPDGRVVDLGRKLFGTWRVWKKPKIFCATLETWDAERGFDGILFNNSFYCVTTPARTLERARALLGANGRIVITISTYFNDAVAYREDGLISRLEDVIPGETLWVYYNEWSLRYRMARHGFELEARQEIPAYGKKTMQAYVFRQSATIIADRAWLSASSAHFQAKWAECFAAFRAQTAATLAALNHGKTILVGTLQVLLDLGRAGPLDRVAAIVVTDVDITGISLGHGWRVVSWGELTALVQQASPGAYEVAICSYRHQDEILSQIRAVLGARVKVLVPNRRSGIESLTTVLRGELVPAKGFTLRPVA